MTVRDPQNILSLDQIKACARDLNALAADTEPEFLKIGKVLNSLADICSSMTEKAVQLSSLATFSEHENIPVGTSFIDHNSKIFQAVGEHVVTTLASLGAGEALLDSLHAEMHQLRLPIRKLHSIGKTFRVLAIAIKVESARTQEGMQGFILLANEVADIARLVDDNCRLCSDKANVVDSDITASQQALMSSNRAYDERGETAIFTILQALEAISGKSDQLAAGLKERSAAMAEGISEVVMAMQFHDSIRQQLGNVATALLATIDGTDVLSRGRSAECNDQKILEIYSILSVQVAHLNSIYQQVDTARHQIERGLRQIMHQARMQAEDAQALLAIESKNSNSSLVAALESEIDTLVVALNASLQVVQQAAAVSREVYDKVVEIGTFINSIEEIAFDVKILAINAMVEASKTQTAGAALNVLAKELSKLSQETRDGATASITMLHSIMAKTEKQLEFSVNLDTSGREVDTLIQQANGFTGAVMSTLQQVHTVSQKIDNSSGDLANRITRLLAHLQFPAIMGDRINRNWQLICTIIERIEDAYPQYIESSTEVREMVEKLSHQYVMEGERAIHAQVAGTSYETRRLEQTSPADSTDNEAEFGDNVELF